MKTTIILLSRRFKLPHIIIYLYACTLIYVNMICYMVIMIQFRLIVPYYYTKAIDLLNNAAFIMHFMYLMYLYSNLKW